MSNLNYWVAGLNDKIEKILVRRLEQLLQAWIDEFVNFETKGGTLIQSKMVLDIKIQNLAIIMEPTMSEARAYWYKELHKQVEVICGLEKVESKKF
jgi:dynein heavy chain 1